MMLNNVIKLVAYFTSELFYELANECYFNAGIVVLFYYIIIEVIINLLNH
jgi:hypothetical protein